MEKRNLCYFIFLSIISLSHFKISAENIDNGKNIYNTNCSMCHGASGAGDGAVGKALTPPLESFSVIFKRKPYKLNGKAEIIKVLNRANGAMPSFAKLVDVEKNDLSIYLIKTFSSNN